MYFELISPFLLLPLVHFVPIDSFSFSLVLSVSNDFMDLHGMSFLTVTCLALDGQNKQTPIRFL